MYKREREFTAVPGDLLPALVVAGRKDWGHTTGEILLDATVRTESA